MKLGFRFGLVLTLLCFSFGVNAQIPSLAKKYGAINGYIVGKNSNGACLAAKELHKNEAFFVGFVRKKGTNHLIVSYANKKFSMNKGQENKGVLLLDDKENKVVYRADAKFMLSAYSDLDLLNSVYEANSVEFKTENFAKKIDISGIFQVRPMLNKCINENFNVNVEKPEEKINPLK